MVKEPTPPPVEGSAAGVEVEEESKCAGAFLAFTAIVQNVKKCYNRCDLVISHRRKPNRYLES